MPALPTGNDLKRLPLRGLIAYSARSALRVQPLFWVDEEHPESQECCTAVDDAIRLALDFAAGKEINPDKARGIEDAVVRAVVVACDEKWSDRQAAFSSNAAYAAINSVTTAMDSESAGSRSTEAVKAVMAAVTTVDAAVAADPAIRHAVIADFKRLSRMSLGCFPNFGKAVDPTGRGILGPINPSRSKVKPSPEINTETCDELRQALQELESLRKALGADRADLEEQRRAVTDAESKLAAERADLNRQQKQFAKRAHELEIERIELQDERGRLALEREWLERARSAFGARQVAFEEDSQRFEANNEAARLERGTLKNPI